MKEDRGQILMENAEKLFSKKGFSETSVEDITKASDCAKGTFYNYFVSKKALLLEMLDSKLNEYMKDFPKDIGSKHIREVLIEDTEMFIKISIDNLSFFHLFFNFVSKNILDKEIKEKHEKYFSIQTEKLVKIFQGAEKTHGFKLRYSEKLEETAQIFNIQRMIYTQKILIAKTDKKELKKLNYRQEAEFIVDLFLYGIKEQKLDGGIL